MKVRVRGWVTVRCAISELSTEVNSIVNEKFINKYCYRTICGAQVAQWPKPCAGGSRTAGSILYSCDVSTEQPSDK